MYAMSICELRTNMPQEGLPGTILNCKTVVRQQTPLHEGTHGSPLPLLLHLAPPLLPLISAIQSTPMLRSTNTTDTIPSQPVDLPLWQLPSCYCVTTASMSTAEMSGGKPHSIWPPPPVWHLATAASCLMATALRHCSLGVDSSPMFTSCGIRFWCPGYAEVVQALIAHPVCDSEATDKYVSDPLAAGFVVSCWIYVNVPPRWGNIAEQRAKHHGEIHKVRIPWNRLHNRTHAGLPHIGTCLIYAAAPYQHVKDSDPPGSGRFCSWLDHWHRPCTRSG